MLFEYNYSINFDIYMLSLCNNVFVSVQCTHQRPVHCLPVNSRNIYQKLCVYLLCMWYNQFDAISSSSNLPLIWIDRVFDFVTKWWNNSIRRRSSAPYVIYPLGEMNIVPITFAGSITFFPALNSLSILFWFYHINTWAKSHRHITGDMLDVTPIQP